MATFPRIAPRRSARATSWWGRAWLRATEEAAYGDADLKPARSLARSGRVGAITVAPGRLLAAVEEGDDVRTVTGSLPVLRPEELAAFAEVVGAESGRIGALLAGDLPHALVEDAEEAGVELLPYGGEIATACSCDHWVDPCHHALAVLLQMGWLMEADPFVLLALRGLERDDLLARLHRATAPPGGASDTDEDVLREAADRAARVLAVLDDPAVDLAALTALLRAD